MKYFGLILSILEEYGTMHYELFENETECLSLALGSCPVLVYESIDLIPIISRVVFFLLDNR